VAVTIRAFIGGQGLDAEALSSVGIDLDAVRESVEATFGPGSLDAGRQSPQGHIPFTPRAKKVLELSLREALALKQKSIGDGHIALGVLREGEGLAMKVLAERGVDTGRLRDDLKATLTS
jgi:ATP-dependent Clp protease ATP-binding subunit ClpA